MKKILIIIIFFFSATIAICMVKLPHEFTNSECTICHTVEKAGSKVKGSLTSKCMTCHTDLFEEGYMHPVDMRPKKVTIPIDLPVDRNGKMTCNTCHDVHSNYETPFGSKSSFLRRLEKGKAFCDICHLNTNSIGSGHQLMFRSAHSTAKYTQSHSGLEIDAISSECISCHDGSVGSSVMLRAGNWRHSNNFIKYDKGGKHPIGMKYERVRVRNKKAMLKPKAMVDKRIRFFNNGCIGCGSCHDPYSTKKNKLVIEIDKSALCFSCHKI